MFIDSMGIEAILGDDLQKLVGRRIIVGEVSQEGISERKSEREWGGY